MLPVYGFKVKLVGHVEIGTHCFGVAVHHNGFKATFFDGEQAVNTAVVEFNTLTNPVGATTENNNFFTLRRNGFVVEDRICHCGAKVGVQEKFWQIFSSKIYWRLTNRYELERLVQTVVNAGVEFDS